MCVHAVIVWCTNKVVSFNRRQYAKASDHVLNKVFCDDKLHSSFHGKTCDGALSQGNMPVQAKANGLKLSSIPSELSCLNSHERIMLLSLPNLTIKYNSHNVITSFHYHSTTIYENPEHNNFSMYQVYSCLMCISSIIILPKPTNLHCNSTLCTPGIRVQNSCAFH